MFDLIDECGKDLMHCGYETVELENFGVTSSKLFVDSKRKAKDLGFDQGHYFIINAPKLDFLMPEHRSILKEEFSDRLSFLLKENKVGKRSKVLFVGIGNPIKIIPNTFSNTGISAYDMIRLLVGWCGVDLVMLFDSLATTNIGRLGCSVQFNDAGLTPGSAMNNFGLPINKDSLNVPCISVGVPMMISSKSLGQKKDVIFTEKDAEGKIDFLSEIVSEVVQELL